MICYRDMTFCTFHEDCARAAECHRPLTDDVKAKAEKWWGGEGAPIAMFAQKPECHRDVLTSDAGERQQGAASISRDCQH